MKIPLAKNNLSLWVTAGFVCAVIIGFFIHYFAYHPSTDDAYVQANTVNVAAQVTGVVDNIYVKDHQLIQKNQLLFTIDPRPFQIAVTRATAALAAQQAELLLAEQNATRILHLVKLGQQPKAAGDQAQSQLDSAKAQLAGDEALLAQAQLDLEHTQVRAPSAGIISQFLLRPGNNVVANMTLFMLVEQSHFWIDANFKETQIAHIKSGQPVKIVLDMFPHKTFSGIVDAVSSASGTVFSLLPPENASGNWVKVTQRFPVKILIQQTDPAYPFRAGATATVTIDTTKV